MLSPQASTIASGTLLTASLAGLVRLCFLRLCSAYPSLVVLFACEFLIVAASEIIGVGTAFYTYLFALLVPLEWFAFGFVMRDLYGSVFARYRGIEILGRWSIYVAFAVSCALALAGAASTGHLVLERKTAVAALEFASGCIIFGSLLLIGSILHTISRYPIALHRNVVVNCRFFALFMLVDAVVLSVNRFTLWRYAVLLNVAVNIVSALILLAWPMLLSREGEVTVLKLRRGIDSREEARLLGQLNAFNDLLLRVARK